MERLTRYFYDKDAGIDCEKCGRRKTGKCNTSADCAKSASDRLAAIEDILGDDYDLDHLRELVKADREGRCKVFKRKIGETVFVIGKSKIVEAKITEIYILDDPKDVEYIVSFNCDESCKGCPFYAWDQDWEGEWCCDCEYGDGAIFQKDFGKTVFFTREAAEAALKGEQHAANV